MVTMGLVASLGFGMSAVASAGGNPPLGGLTTTTGAVTSTLKTYQKQLTAYRATRSAIEATFRASVQTARSNYQKALLTATTAAQRSAAEQSKMTAIINAASARSSALVALGNAPAPPDN
jgi:hypothetical protein